MGKVNAEPDMVLAKIDRAKSFLAEARDLMDVKHVIDLATAARVYAIRVNASIETVNKATEIRLRAERRLGELLLTMPKATGGEQGGRPRKDGKPPHPGVGGFPNQPTLKESGIDYNLSSRSQKIASVPESKFEAALNIPEDGELIAKHVVNELVGKKTHVAHNSGENEWYTPDEFLDAARKVLGEIELDPATSEIAQRRVKAKAFYTAENDGLAKPWRGKTWMNPPYAGHLIGKFMERLRLHIESGDIPEAIVLVNNATETDWFQSSASLCSSICFPEKRIRFLDPDGNPGAPLQGQAILYFGDRPAAFLDRFLKFGITLENRTYEDKKRHHLRGGVRTRQDAQQ